jgi:hypothetical protein
MVMVIGYLLYIILMALNPKVEKWAHRTKKRLTTKVFPNRPVEDDDDQPPQPQSPKQQGGGSIEDEIR